MYFSSLVLVAHNEKSTVCVRRSLDAALLQYDEAHCDGTSVNTNNPAYLSCPLSEASLSTWSPSDFGVQWLKGAFTTSAVKVSQKVETLQCKEHRHQRSEKRGDKTVNIESWTYTLSWEKTYIDSSQFKAWSNAAAKDALHSGCGSSFSANPRPALESKVLAVQSLVAGSFDLSRHLDKIYADHPVVLQQSSYESPSVVGKTFERRVAQDGKVYTRAEFHEFYGRDRGEAAWQAAHGTFERRVAKDGNSYTKREFHDHYGQGRGDDEWQAAAHDDSYKSSLAQVVGDTVHTCQAGSENVGCMKIAYYKSTATHASYMGQISGQASRMQTRPWIPPATWLCGVGSSEVDLFHASAVSAKELVDIAASSNTIGNWVLRIVGILLAVVGIMMFLNPLQTVANVVDEFFNWFRFIPVAGWLLDKLGDAVAGAVGCAIFAVSLCFGASSALLVLSITWCIMRPVIGVPILLLSMFALFYSVKYLIQLARDGHGKRKNPNKVQ